MNQTFLGETGGSWAIAILGLLASVGLGLAAVWSSKRAGDAASKANKIASDAIEREERREARDERIRLVHRAYHQLDLTIREMGVLATSSPLPTMFPFTKRESVASFASILRECLAKMEQYVHYMNRALFLSNELGGLGFKVIFPDGRRFVFESQDMIDQEAAITAARHVLGDAEAIVAGENIRGDPWRTEISDSLSGAAIYWSKRRYQLPVIRGFEEK